MVLDVVKQNESNNPETLYKELIEEIVKYHPSSDISLIHKAYCVARNAHEGQFRKSGEPYIIHPLSVAMVLARLELDKETIAAGLLHDVVEDTGFTNDEIAEMFNQDVAHLVDGVTKLERIPYVSDNIEMEAENLRKMFLAMAKDIRVILIKLADRLHNMRTLRFRSEENQKKVAKETLDIYAPLANRLGISKIKNELDDLSLKYLEKDVYYDLAKKIEHTKEARETFIKEMMRDVRENLEENGLEAKVDGRAKHFFSIYRKMINQNKTLEQIYDLFAIRIILDSVKNCYAALGIMHECYKPVPGRFKDYIAMPKTNKYQSIHTTLIAPNGQLFEVQIRTKEMHKVAEYGIAAHWKYKEGIMGKTTEDKEEEKLSWLREILEWQREMSDNKEFMLLLKNDLNVFSERIYCFTPKGEVKNLPNGSNPIDFAYNIHSAVGNKMVGARVNGKMVPFDYIIQNGDRIEIITSQNSKGPSRDWLKIVKSTQAKNKINQWFVSELKEDNIQKGKELLAKYCKAKGIVQSEIQQPELMDQVIKKYGFKDWDSLLASLGHGGLKEGQIVNKLLDLYEGKRKKTITDETVLREVADGSQKNKEIGLKSKSEVLIKGVAEVAVRYSKCCNPVPGDEIIGFITRGRGVTIHRTDCINIMDLPELDRGRLIEADWKMDEELETSGRFLVGIRIYANNRTGILTDISKILTEQQIDLLTLNSRTNRRGVATININFKIRGKDELVRLMEMFRRVESVVDVERTRG